MKSNGQSLIEVTIAIGVAVIVIGALTITILIGLRNNQFSQNQLQATKLAQAGMEFIKVVRDRNNPICNTVDPPPPADYFWDTEDLSKQPTLWNNTGWDGIKKFYLLTGSTDGSCQLTDNAQSASSEKKINNKFSRNVYIKYSGDDQIKFTVEVFWEDNAGAHSSELITVLTNH